MISGRKLGDFEGEYYTIPEASREYNFTESSLRKVLNKERLDELGVQRNPEDILETLTSRKYVSKSLMDALVSVWYKPASD